MNYVLLKGEDPFLCILKTYKKNVKGGANWCPIVQSIDSLDSSGSATNDFIKNKYSVA